MTDWNPGALLKLSGSYWQTCTLHAAVKLELFSRLGTGTATARDLARRHDLDPRGLAVLLNALAAMNLVEKKGEAYACTPEARRFLDTSSDQYIGHMIMHHHHLADSWVRMDEAVRQGGPIRQTAASPDPVVRESFLMGMFNNAMAIAPAVSRLVDLSGCQRLLDLGGGPGTYAIHFCLANPDLTAVVFDLPTTRPFAERTIRRFAVDDRASFADGDYTEGPLDLDPTFDAAWLSHILHGEGPDMAGAVIEKTIRVLKPGGRIFIHEFILDNTLDSPLFPALFSMNMFLGTREGQSYSQADLEGMLLRCGVTDIRRLNFTGPTESGIICGRAAG